jgi:4-amino-4-deoxy-L-arabinose transferase-like glycosyltransferase
MARAVSELKTTQVERDVECPQNSPALTPTLARWTPPLVLLVVGAVMLTWTWGKWPDVLVDFGRELYVAWQIAAGKVLYRDLAYVQGPLSPYLNAFWFTLFGASIRTLVFANLALLAFSVCLLYRLLAEIGGRFSATVAGLVFLTLFAFVQYGVIGNYNYICPYRHETTHGMLLSLGALACFAAYLRISKTWTVAGAGFCTGLLALTKGEFLVAEASALFCGFFLLAWFERTTARQLLRTVSTFLAAAIVPPLLAFCLLALAMPATEALRGVFGSWPATFNEAFRSSPFIQRGMGTENMAASLKAILDWSLGYVLVLLPAAGIGLWLRTRRWHRPVVAAGMSLLLWLELQTHFFHWREVLRPLPLLMVGLALVSLTRLVQQRADAHQSRRLILRLALIVFAGVLLGRMTLNARLYHYGFVYAMPATMLLVTALVGWVPNWIDRRGGFGWAFRGVALVLLLTVGSWYLNAARGRLAAKTVQVASGANAFLADKRGEVVNETLATIRQQSSPQDTLLVLPEGVMLSFLSSHTNPTRFVDFVPTEFFYYGEDRLLAAVAAHPPDYVALVQSDTSEFGYRFFGQDYGQRLMEWVRSRYHEVALAGQRPFMDEDFGILLLRRNK